MKYAVEMTLGGTIYMPHLIKFSSGLQTLLGAGGHIQTHAHKAWYLMASHTESMPKVDELVRSPNWTE
jgi:hypothetical protein